MNVHFDDEDKPADHETSGLTNSRVAVSTIAVDRAIGTDGRRLLKRWSGMVATVKVPSWQWVIPVQNVLRTINPRIRFASETEKAKVRSAASSETAIKIANGGVVVGVSSDPDGLLPDIFRSAATHHYEVLPPTADLVAQAMKGCLTGRAPGQLKGMDFSSIDFDLLCACMPMGITKADAMRRLERALAPARAPISKTTLAYPTLDDAVEYGDARTWGMALRADLEDLRSGKIAWPDMDRGAVLEGPAGSGKTTFAQILGNACGLPVVMGSMAELFATSDGHLDGVIKSQRKLFDRAKAVSPCILFIDEINALPNPAVLSSRNRDWWLPVIYDFYLLLDSAMSSREGVVVIGATNRVEDLSVELLRPGRLERAIHIGAPSTAGLINILRTHLRGELAGEDLTAAADAGLGATAAMAMEWVRAARRIARRENRGLDLKDLLSQIIPVETRSVVDRYRAAIHEAGHAVVGVALGERLLEVSIASQVASGGRAVFEPASETLFDRERLERHVTMLLAGAAAEMEVFGSASSGAGGSRESDLAKATSAMATLRSSFGMRDTLLWVPPEEVATLLRHDTTFRSAVDADLRRLFGTALEMAGRNRAKILDLADVLVREGKVSGIRVTDMVGARPAAAAQ